MTGGTPAGPPSSIWYSRAFNYWESEANCPVTDDGVLGGYGKLTPMDVKGSNQFLDELVALRPELCFDVAADCGAGIGRVSKNLLLHRFARVDLIEQSPRLTKAAPAYIGPDSSRAACICQGLQVPCGVSLDVRVVVGSRLCFTLLPSCGCDRTLRQHRTRTT